MRTLRVREHAHQRRKLGRATPMGNMKPPTSRAMHPAGLRSRLVLLVLRLLLFLLHGEQRRCGRCTSSAVKSCRFSKDRRIGRDSQSEELGLRYAATERSKIVVNRQSSGARDQDRICAACARSG